MFRCTGFELGDGGVKGDRLPQTALEYPFSFHLNATEHGDTRDRLSIKHSEKRLKGRFYLLLFLQFHDCSDKLGDAYLLPGPE